LYSTFSLPFLTNWLIVGIKCTSLFYLSYTGPAFAKLCNTLFY